MIKNDKTRFHVTFNNKDLEVFKEVAKASGISISGLISMSAVYGLKDIIALAKKENSTKE